MRRALFLLLISVAALAGSFRRDWSSFPAIAQSDAQSDIYVVGDVHADYQRLVRVLAAAGLIEKNPGDPRHPVWTAKNAVAVFVGDLIDKGPRALDVLDFVHSLRAAAKAQGGEVFSLMGNHEAEFLANPVSKKSREFAAELESHGMSPGDVASCRGSLGSFLCDEPFALRIREWFFSHAGDTHGRTLAVLAADLQTGVDKDGFASRQLIGADSILEARLGERAKTGVPGLKKIRNMMRGNC